MTAWPPWTSHCFRSVAARTRRPNGGSSVRVTCRRRPTPTSWSVPRAAKEALDERAKRPGIQVIVHPECTYDACRSHRD
jgi:hypothetical protein